MARGSGFLAIWSDVEPRQETDYLHWLTREHTAERLSIPGFLGVRVFRARLAGHCRYFILYRLEEPGVLGSRSYLARLNAPTQWSRRTMPILGNFIRGGGGVVAEAGSGQGGIILPLVLEANEIATARALLDAVAAMDRVVSARILEVEPGGTGIQTTEKSMRAQDRSFAALLLIEALAGDALDHAHAEVAKTMRPNMPALVYDQVFALNDQDVIGGGGLT
ncbi:MAG TPA: hypothetical protein VIA80_00410 [Hyphomonadaceae bacterium]